MVGISPEIRTTYAQSEKKTQGQSSPGKNELLQNLRALHPGYGHASMGTITNHRMESCTPASSSLNLFPHGRLRIPMFYAIQENISHAAISFF